MSWKQEWKILLGLVAVFLAAYFLPVGEPRFDNAVTEAFSLTKWYAREHVVLCLLPAFFIAGAISVFVSKASVLKYLGAKANKVLAYGVAAVSGTILAVCSCTVLPLFAGIWKRGAGLGPATAFLYSGPAINVLAIILTARILGLELGVARAVGAVVFSVVIGLLMYLIFRKEEQAKADAAAATPEPEVTRPLWQTVLYFAAMVAVLVLANWAVRKEGDPESFYYAIGSVKWGLTAVAAAGLGAILVAWFGVKWWKIALVAAAVVVVAVVLPGEPVIAFAAGVVGLAVITSTDKGEVGEWFAATWTFTKQITPLLLGGILVSGFLLGGPGKGGVVPAEWISGAVGGNSLGANFFASLAGALMYFATLTEVPILQGLIGSGMGQGPALALLLAGPALSLPSMIVLASVMGVKKMLAYVSLVVVMATITGMSYGMLF
jgi:uncharacterized membrane protein YraQ (UPF0718 family)